MATDMAGGITDMVTDMGVSEAGTAAHQGNVTVINRALLILWERNE